MTFAAMGAGYIGSDTITRMLELALASLLLVQSDAPTVPPRAKIVPATPIKAAPAAPAQSDADPTVFPGSTVPFPEVAHWIKGSAPTAFEPGKTYVVEFWATWCGPCKAAMPTMQKLHDEYASKGAVILGVNTWEQKADAAKDYMASKKFTYGCLLKGDDLATAYGISGIPTLVVIGKDGKVVEIEVGLADPSGAGLRKLLDAALKK